MITIPMSVSADKVTVPMSASSGNADLRVGMGADYELHTTMIGVTSWNGETGDVTYTAPVTSVNGQTGDVIVQSGVSSINGETGDVVLDASDVGALPFNTQFVSSFNGQNGAVIYTAPVTSVNGQTGDVTVSGLPDASQEVDGTAFVAVGGEWTKQTGYGYAAQEMIEDLQSSSWVVSDGTCPLLLQTPIEDGANYTIVYDGTTYETTAWSGTYQGEDFTCIGNGMIIGLPVGDQNCPFLMVNVPGESYQMLIGVDGTHTLSVSHIGTTYTTFNRDYIPKIGVGENVSGKTQMGYDDVNYVGGTDAIRFKDGGASGGEYTVSFGDGIASGLQAFAAQRGKATGAFATAFGSYSIASGDNSFVEGNGCSANGLYSHAEGDGSQAEGQGSHAENHGSAHGQYSHAEGSGGQAYGYASHAEGMTVAFGDYQHTFGKANVEDRNSQYVEIVGKGVNYATPSNARTLDWTGNEVLAGKLTVGANPTANMDVATKQYVDGHGVTSFNGSTGAITYTAPVTSVNGQTGDVTVTSGLTPLIGTTAQVTPTQVATAVAEGRTVAITHTIPFFGDATFANFGASQTLNMVVSTTMVYQRNSFNVFQLIGILSSNAWSIQMGIPIVDFTPTGTVSRPTITCTPTTASVNSITGVGTLPTLTDDVTNETLSFSWAQGTLPTQGTAQTVMTGVSAISSEPTFSGNPVSKAVELFVD